MDDENDTQNEDEKIHEEEPEGPNSAEWFLLFMAVITIDLLQVGLDALFQVGVILNRFIDVVVGLGLGLYFKMRGVKMDFKKTGTLIGTFILEEVPDLDILPFWSLDVLVTLLLDKGERQLKRTSALAGEALERAGKISGKIQGAMDVIHRKDPGSAGAEAGKNPPSLPGSKPPPLPQSSPVPSSMPPPLPRTPPPLPTQSAETTESFQNDRPRSRLEKVEDFSRNKRREYDNAERENTNAIHNEMPVGERDSGEGEFSPGSSQGIVDKRGE